MSVLLWIAILSVVIKLVVSYEVITRYPVKYHKQKPELLIFIFSFLAYSILLIFVFSPIVDGHNLGVTRAYVVRAHYFLDGACLGIASYALPSLIGASSHKTWLVKTLLALYILVGGYFLLFTDAFISSVYFHGQNTIGLGGASIGNLIVVPRLLVALCITAVVIGIIRNYRTVQEGQGQVRHLYILFAFLLYAINCFMGLFAALPILIALRGLLLFSVVMFVVHKSRLFDLRSVIPGTKEKRAITTFRSTFRRFTADEVGYRSALQDMERAMVEYKLQKISGFREDNKSALPRVANSMQLSLSSLYDLLKRLEIKQANDK